MKTEQNISYFVETMIIVRNDAVGQWKENGFSDD